MGCFGGLGEKNSPSFVGFCVFFLLFLGFCGIFFVFSRFFFVVSRFLWCFLLFLRWFVSSRKAVGLLGRVFLVAFQTGLILLVDHCSFAIGKNGLLGRT